jgi:hypothetical protein
MGNQVQDLEEEKYCSDLPDIGTVSPLQSRRISCQDEFNRGGG